MYKFNAKTLFTATYFDRFINKKNLVKKLSRFDNAKPTDSDRG